MKLKSIFFLFFLLFYIPLSAQEGVFSNKRTSMVNILEALSNTDIIIKNKRLSKKIKSDMRALQKKGPLNDIDYGNLKVSYKNLRYAYNNDYLAQIKMDLSDVQNYNTLVKDPGEAANRYVMSYGVVADVYNDNFLPVLQDILYEEEEQADFITILKVGFKIFKKIVIIIKERKIEKSDLLQIAVTEANDFLFKKIELPEWNSYGITLQEGYEEETYTEEETSENTPPAEMEVPQQMPPAEETTLPPFSTATVPFVDGQFNFEVYDENTGVNIPMNFQIGSSQQVGVIDFGQGDISADLIVGKPGRKIQSLTPVIANTTSTYVTSFVSSKSYPVETYYQIKASTNGFTYIFSINSNNKMYSFYPYQGEIEKVPSGIGFIIPATSTSLQNPDGSGSAKVSIPDRENYLVTYDPNGVPPNAETLVVLFSRAELDLRSIFQQMESMDASTSPQERLAQILGTQTATLEQGEVQLIGDTFSYQLTEEDPIVLPLVFALKRQ